MAPTGDKWIVRYFERRFRETGKAFDLKSKAVDDKFNSIDKALEELRAIQRDHIPRDLFFNRIDGLREEIDKLRAEQLKREGEVRWKQYVPWAIAVAAIIFAYIKK